MTLLMEIISEQCVNINGLAGCACMTAFGAVRLLLDINSTLLFLHFCLSALFCLFQNI